MSAKLTISIAAVVAAIIVLLSWSNTSDEIRDPQSQPARLPAIAKPPIESTEDAVNPAVQIDAISRDDIKAPTEPAQTQSVYDVVFGRPEPGNPLWETHLAFTNEPRDESWASAMESGISQHIAKSETSDWATVDKIECRSTICEVLGFMPDAMENPELEPHNLISDGFGLGWWQGVGKEVMTRQHTYDAEGITRFMLIIVRIDEHRYGPPD